MALLYFPICSLFIITFIVICFYSKERLQGEETKIYKKLLIFNLFETIFSIIILSTGYFFGTTYAVYLFNRLDFICCAAWIWTFSLYIYYVSIGAKRPDIYDKVSKISGVVNFIMLIFILFLPLKIYENGDVAYAYGASTTLLYVSVIVNMIGIFICMFFNFKNLKNHKYIPLYVFIILIIVTLIIRSINPGLLVVSAVISYIDLIMFFTIENPDVKIIEELTKAQKLSENTSNEKSNFIHLISEDINNKLDNAEKISDNVLLLNPDNNVKEYMNDLKELINVARTKLNQTIDISDMDLKHLNITNNKYNVKNILESVYTLKKSEIKNDIDYRLNISEELPKELYGDSIKLKQILASLIDNSIKNTEKGFIELRVNSIIKNDICRLIITVEDSGSGIDAFKQNEIMSNMGELTEEDIKKLNKMNLDLKIVRKMVSAIGGTFVIDKNKYSGTSISINLDQRIYYENKTIEEEKIEKYSEEIKSQKKCAIVSLSKQDIKTIKAMYKKYYYKVDEFDGTKKLLDLLREKNTYDVIYIDEDMEKIDARSFLSKCKDIEEFNSKIIVISKNNTIKNKKDILELGFDGIVNSPVSKKELNEKI